MSKQRAQDLADLLAECLAAAEAGSADRDQCLAQHSHDEATLRELVPLAMELRQMPAQAPSAAFRARGYRSLMTEIEQQPNWRWQLRHILESLAAIFAGGGLKRSPAWVCVFAAVILCLGTGGAVLAAEGALPGDPLYGLKTTVEDVRLAVTPAEGNVSLRARFAERRLDEIEGLVAAGRLADVPQAAAGYETHVGQALAALASAGETDVHARARLAAQLDRMLVEQTAELDALAGQMPVQMAPVIQHAQSASTDAQNVIRQLWIAPGTSAMPDPQETVPSGRSAVDTQEPAMTPPVSTPQTEHSHPEGQATGVPTESPTPTPTRPRPDDAGPAYPDDRNGEPPPTPRQPPSAMPGTPAAPGGRPTPQGTPATNATPVPPAETRPASTPAPPSTPPDGAPPAFPPASTPAAPPAPPGGASPGSPPAGTPVPPPASPGDVPPGSPPASTPAAPSALPPATPGGGSRAQPPPASTPSAHADDQLTTMEVDRP